MENTNIANFSTIIRLYAKNNDLRKKFYKCHENFLIELLNIHNIHETESSKSSTNREFVNFVLWSCLDFCKIILNKNLWNYQLDLIEQELLDKNCAFDQNNLGLYSILKFIGQYTDNKNKYDKCCKIIESLPDNLPINIIEPKQIRHLFAFNTNFKNDYITIPPKIIGSNRLVQFEFGATIGNTNYLKHYEKYKSNRCYHAQFMLIKNPSESVCLYYLDSLYYQTKNKFISIQKLFQDNCNDLAHSSYIRNILEKITSYNCENSNCCAFNDLNIVTNAYNAIENKINLFYHDNMFNHEEIHCVIFEALTINDVFVNKNEYYDIFRCGMFQKLYELDQLCPLDKYTSYAMKCAETDNIIWMQTFIRNRINTCCNNARKK